MTEYLVFQGTSMAEPYYGGMCKLHDAIFAGQSADNMIAELKKKPNGLILLATCGGEVVGFKIGYEERTTRFYSWLGGVSPDHRGHGIASGLMKQQHEWCCQQGYQTIRTHTKNKWRDMLILNLKHGFDIIGTYTDGTEEPKIILEKRL